MRKSMHAIPLSIIAAAILAMAGAFFGAAVARVIWAEDLRQAQARLNHAQELRKIWDETEASYKEHISILQRHVEELKKQTAITGTPH
jgi:hypothetical protein